MLVEKIVDFMDVDVCMVILMDTLEEFSVMAETIVSIGRKRCHYEVYKNEMALYMMELRLPHNRYMAMMKELRSHGWNLKPETKVDIFNRMVRD